MGELPPPPAPITADEARELAEAVRLLANQVSAYTNSVLQACGGIGKLITLLDSANYPNAVIPAALTHLVRQSVELAPILADVKARFWKDGKLKFGLF